MVIKIKKNKSILKRKLASSEHYDLLPEELAELGKEDREFYLFLRGGFTSK